jgi:hypothetical protein
MEHLGFDTAKATVLKKEKKPPATTMKCKPPLMSAVKKRKMHSSVVDPQHFSTDPDPAPDLAIEVLDLQDAN